MNTTPLTPVNSDNCKLRLDFLEDCRASGMPEARVLQRYSTTEHLVRRAGDKPLWKYSIGELNQVLANTPALNLSHGEKPLSYERLRKVYLHARELLAYAIEQYPTQFKQRPRHLRNLTPPVQVGVASTDRRPYYTLDEVLKIAAADFSNDLILRRAQAVACLQFVSGMRSGALATLPLHALDLDNLKVDQNPKHGIRTKNAKSAITFLVNLPEVLKPIQGWCQFLSEQVSPNAMVFNVFDDLVVPIRLTDRTPGQSRVKHVNDGYQKLCDALSLPYRASHAFRHGHIVFCLQKCKTPAEFLALSQNVMHADVKMTEHYGAQDVSGIQAAYAQLCSRRVITDRGRSLRRGNGLMDVSQAMETLTVATKSQSLVEPQREMLVKLTLELLPLLMLK